MLFGGFRLPSAISDATSSEWHRVYKKKSGSLVLLTPLSEAFGLAHHSGLSNEDSTPYMRIPQTHFKCKDLK